MSTIQSILRVLPLANRGISLLDKQKVFLVIAFETTSFKRVERRNRIKQRIEGLADESGILTIHFRRDGHNFVFKLRASDNGDISVASEFIRAGYRFPDSEPAQIIDGGANIGLFSVLASKTFPNVEIECYEASPANIDALQRNIDINGTNAKVLNHALWSGPSELVFHSHLAYSGRVSDQAGDADGSVRVPAVLPEVRKDCWIKLDIEGAEYEVLPALLAAGTLPRWISAELHHFREKGPALIEQLRDHGYDISGVPEVIQSDLVELFAERK